MLALAARPLANIASISTAQPQVVVAAAAVMHAPGRLGFEQVAQTPHGADDQARAFQLACSTEDKGVRALNSSGNWVLAGGTLAI